MPLHLLKRRYCRFAAPGCWLVRRGAAAACLAMLLSGCAMVGPASQGRAQPLAEVQSFGMAFVGRAQTELPGRLTPGPGGDLIVYASGLGLSLLWVPGWLLGAPLWMPGLLAAQEASCRAAVNAHAQRLAALRQALADWNVLADLNARLAVRLAGGAPARRALADADAVAAPPADGTGVDPVPRMLARARALGLQAVAVFEVSAIELQAEGAGACATSLFVAGRIRALRAADGALLEFRVQQSDDCRRNAAVPLEQLLTDDSMLAIMKDAAVDCAAREFIYWTDHPRSTP